MSLHIPEAVTKGCVSRIMRPDTFFRERGLVLPESSVSKRRGNALHTLFWNGKPHGMSHLRRGGRETVMRTPANAQSTYTDNTLHHRGCSPFDSSPIWRPQDCRGHVSHLFFCPALATLRRPVLHNTKPKAKLGDLLSTLRSVADPCTNWSVLRYCRTTACVGAVPSHKGPNFTENHSTFGCVNGAPETFTEHRAHCKQNAPSIARTSAPRPVGDPQSPPSTE